MGEQGYVSWGAGNANPYAPVQIELQRTYDKALFEKTIELILNIQEIVQKYGIPLTLDQGTSLFTKGIISHLWVTNYVWGTTQIHMVTYRKWELAKKSLLMI